MAYAYTIEMLGMEKGLIKGRQEGRQEGLQEGQRTGRQAGEAALLIRQLMRKFNNIPDTYLQKVQQADADTLLVWGEKILDAKSLIEVFQ